MEMGRGQKENFNSTAKNEKQKKKQELAIEAVPPTSTQSTFFVGELSRGDPSPSNKL